MGKDLTRDAHFKITKCIIARDINCDVTMCNDIAMYTCHGFIMHNDMAINHGVWLGCIHQLVLICHPLVHELLILGGCGIPARTHA